MKIEDVLKLDKTTLSIKKIDFFCLEQDKSSISYAKALAYKSEILCHLKKYGEAVELLIDSLAQGISDECIILLSARLIEIALDIKNYELALKYINFKAKHLDVLNKYQNTVDMVKYFHALNNKLEVKRNSAIALQDDLPEEIRMYIIQILADYAFEEKDYNKYLEYANRLEDFYRLKFEFSKVNDLALYRAFISYDNKDYDLAIDSIKAIIDDTKNSIEQKIKFATLLIKAYNAKKDYKRSSIIESEYTYDLDNAKPEVALAFCNEALELYQNLKNSYSVNLYEGKIAKLRVTIKKNALTFEKTSPSVIISPQTIESTSIVTKPIINEEVKKKITYKKGDFKAIEISEAYQSLQALLQEINSIDETLFREFFRKAGIIICKKMPILELVIVYQQDEYLGFHYKKERVYDKKFEYDKIQNTIPYQTLENKDEIYVDDLSKCDYPINIASNDLYPEFLKTCYSFCLKNSQGIYGSLSFFSDERFIDKSLCYEQLVIIYNIINAKLNSFLSIQSATRNYENYALVFQKGIIGFKEENNGYLGLNKQAQEILEVEDGIELTEFLFLMDNADLIEYRKIHEDLQSYKIQTADIKYHITTNDTKKYIHEKLVASVHDGNVNIYSTLEAITEYEKKEELLKKVAFTDPLSKLDSRAKLFTDMKALIVEKKFALALINVNNFKFYNDIYGISFGDELIYAVGKTLKEELSKKSDIACYHLGSDKFALLFLNINDKRTVYNHTINLLVRLGLKLNSLNKRLNITFCSGVFRYTKNIMESDLEKIMHYASDALLLAHEKAANANSVEIFEQSVYKKRFFENQLITHISECIDNNSLAVNYCQIVNVTKSNVEYYYARLNLVNYDVNLEDFYEVIKKKGLLDNLDKYLIMHTLMELKAFFDATGYYIKVIIVVDSSVVEKEDFVNYLFGQLKFFKLPTNIITLQIDNLNCSLNEAVKRLIEAKIAVASKNIDDVLLNLCTIYLHDNIKYSKVDFTSFKEICDRLNCQLIVNNVNNKKDVERCVKAELPLIMGECFKKKFKIKELISLVDKPL